MTSGTTRRPAITDLHIGADVGGWPDSYPVRYEILILKDGAVLKLADALGRHAEVVLSADDARLLALGLLGALPGQAVSGMLGAGLDGGDGDDIRQY